MAAAEIVDLYCAAWDEPDAGRRRALLEQAWADDGVYVDPTAHVSGRDALVEHIGGTYEVFGSFSMRRTSGVDEHHDYVRFTWEMVTDAGDPIADGFDVARLAPDGRVQLVVGFFGPFPT